MPILGLDLGRNNFRALELEERKGNLIVNRFGSYENPRLNLDSDVADDIELYSNALKEFISMTGFTTPNTVVGLDETYVYMRIIKVPKMSDKELANAVQYEAEQYIPLPLNEVKVSHQKLDVDFDSGGKLNVQLVAAKTSIIEKHVKILKNAGLVPKAIEPETLALGRALGEFSHTPKGTIILDIGLMRSILIVVYNGYVRFTRSIQIGGDTITKVIQQRLNLDYTQAEESKKAYGLDRNQADGKIYDAAHTVIDRILTELRRAIVFFTKQHPGANIKRVILTGGTARMPGLLLYMANNLDVEVEISNPFNSVELSPKIESKRNELIENSSIYTTAFGLALRGLKGH